MKLQANKTVTVKLPNKDMVTVQEGEVVEVPDKFQYREEFDKVVEEKTVNPADMKKSELIQFAEDNNFEITKSVSKEKILEQIQEQINPEDLEPVDK